MMYHVSDLVSMSLHTADEKITIFGDKTWKQNNTYQNRHMKRSSKGDEGGILFWNKWSQEQVDETMKILETRSSTWRHGGIC